MSNFFSKFEQYKNVNIANVCVLRENSIWVFHFFQHPFPLRTLHYGTRYSEVTPSRERTAPFSPICSRCTETPVCFQIQKPSIRRASSTRMGYCWKTTAWFPFQWVFFHFLSLIFLCEKDISHLVLIFFLFKNEEKVRLYLLTFHRGQNKK